MSNKYTEEQAKKILSQEKTFNLGGNKVPDLRMIRTEYLGLKVSPSDIPSESPEGVVFYTLQTCYLREKNVSEGKLKDVIDGFHHSGIPHAVTWDGLRKLKELGYMKFTDANGIVIMGGVADMLWYQWTPKFLDLLMEPGQGKTEVEVVRQDYKTAKWDNIT